MATPVDFKGKSKQIRKLQLAALRTEADRLLAEIEDLLTKDLEVIKAIEADQTLSKKERQKLVAQFVQEQTAVMDETENNIKSKLESFRNQVPGKIEQFRKGK